MTVKQEVYRDVLQEGYELHWYKVKSVLGRGAFGVTYLAQDNNLDQLVAIKEYFPHDFSSRDTGSTVHPSTGENKELFEWGLTRFIREAQTLAKFKHHNIVRVMSVFELNNTAYMVMEYEQGEELSKLYKKNKNLTEQELLAIFLPILDGLRLVHDAGFIHRDIKPANIYIREDGSPVLIDFGAARKTVGTPTRAITSLVTHGYAPFEQYNESDDKQGPWTDIYALGACLYNAVYGKLPLDALVRGSSLLSDGADPYDPISVAREGEHSPNFLRAIDHALMFQAQNRPQDVRVWADMLSGKVDVPAVPLELYKKPNDINDDATVILTSPPSGKPATQSPSSIPPTQPPSGIPPTQPPSSIPPTQPPSSIPPTQAPTSMPPGTDQSTNYQVSATSPVGNLVNTKVLALLFFLSALGGGAVVFFLGGDASNDEVMETQLEDKQQQLATLIVKADEARKAGILLNPDVGAIYLYKQVLNLDPSNTVAASRIKEIVELYADGVRSDLAEGFHDKAQSNIRLLKAAMPDSTVVLMLNEELRNAKAEIQVVSQLIKQAEVDFNAGRLNSPKDQNALNKYRRALAMEPGNLEAIQGIEKIQVHFISLAKKSLVKADTVSAERYISDIFSVDPNSIEGKNLSKELQRIKSRNAKQQQIAQLLSQAQSAYKAGKITRPANDNALTLYKRVLKLDSKNVKAKQGVQKVERYLKSLFDKYMSAGKHKSAGTVVKNVERVMPRSWLARKIRADWEAKKPKPKPKAKSDIDIISDMIAKFKKSFEGRDAKALRSMSEYKPNRQEFVKQIFKNYKSFQLNISDIQFIGRERKGAATISIVDLVNVQGVPVEPGTWSRFDISIARNAKGRWKVIW